MCARALEMNRERERERERAKECEGCLKSRAKRLRVRKYYDEFCVELEPHVCAVWL